MNRSAKMKALWADPVYRARAMASKLRVTTDPGYRARMSTALKARWADPEFRVRNLTAQEKAAATPSGVARLKRPRREGPLMKLHPRSLTAVPGIGYAEIGPRNVPYFIAHCGPRGFRFSIRRLGRDEAFRRALKKRAAYELAWQERRAA